jgi:agmatine deiminase
LNIFVERKENMARRIFDSTPKQDGFRMPGEFEPHSHMFMIWPERPDNWREGGKPAQKVYAEIATAISRFTPLTMLVNNGQYANARARLPESVRVVELTSDDAWVRDCGPTFLVNDKGDVRAVDWTFNAWGGLYDGLYFPWANDDAMAQKICELQGIDSYRTEDFVLEGGSIHVDGEGTLITTEMCLLSPGRNPDMTKEEIEAKLKEYLNLEKIIWIKDGIDPDETNGHVDDVACFVRPGEVACIYTDDKENPFYEQAQAAYKTLSEATDAKGRKLKVHKLCVTKEPCYLRGADTIDIVQGTIPREEGEISIASYMNFLITNKAIILPQYGDENDALASAQVQEMFPDYEIIPIRTEEVAYGGGNIHCITQQQPRG